MTAEGRESGNCSAEMSLPPNSLAVGFTLGSASRPVFLKVEGENLPHRAKFFFF
jgi:hypothetical protein